MDHPRKDALAPSAEGVLMHCPQKRPSLGFRVSHQFLSGDRATRQALAILSEKLLSRGVGEVDLQNLELLLAEVLNNLAEHAYRATRGPVDLSVILRRDGIHCRVADQGSPIPALVLKQRAVQPAATPADPPEGGWGWFLISTLAQNISYEHSNHWNVLTMILPWNNWPERMDGLNMP